MRGRGGRGGTENRGIDQKVTHMEALVERSWKNRERPQEKTKRKHEGSDLKGKKMAGQRQTKNSLKKN